MMRIFWAGPALLVLGVAMLVVGALDVNGGRTTRTFVTAVVIGLLGLLIMAWERRRRRAT